MHAPFEMVHENELILEFALCKRCGLVFQSSQMSAEGRKQYYSGSYRALVQGSESPTDKDLRVQSGRARHIIRFAKKYLREVGTHLDIGSSSGALLAQSHAEWNAEVVGVEPGDAYREYSEGRGITTTPRLEDLEGRSFDLISLAHVLEHLPKPVQYLERLREKWLEPEGHLLIEVPNLYGHQSLELSHTVAFSRATLHEVLRQAGFDIVRMIAHSEPRSRLLSLYLLVLARAGKELATQNDIRSVSRGVRLRRKLGNMRRRRLTELLPGFIWKPLPEMD
ncbi:MAG: class I SAM-dependent methyltransferase [Anaerolineales bacterium]